MGVGCVSASSCWQLMLLPLPGLLLQQRQHLQLLTSCGTDLHEDEYQMHTCKVQVVTLRKKCQMQGEGTAASIKKEG